MTDLALKESILREAGYSYRPDRELYINRKTQKAFSIDFLEDNEPGEIARRIREVVPANGWTFIFTDKLSDSVKRELAKVLDA